MGGPVCCCQPLSVKVDENIDPRKLLSEASPQNPTENKCRGPCPSCEICPDCWVLRGLSEQVRVVRRGCALSQRADGPETRRTIVRRRSTTEGTRGTRGMIKYTGTSRVHQLIWMVLLLESKINITLILTQVDNHNRSFVVL